MLKNRASIRCRSQWAGQALGCPRLGLEALRALADVIVPMMQPLWIDEELHAAAVAALFAAGRRRLSLVDCASFELMRRRGLTEAFALDDDFARQGFRLLPGS